ncbi:MAG TPA: helix-turn-helix transcriptional regulator [Candidatus Acidoferrum sp.]|jgi:transcriptional regulator with XRE-family HTH domain
MIIGERIRQLREQKKLSQGDIEKHSGLLRAYISRVENGHTIPTITTLEKLAAAIECPLYQFFYEGEVPPPASAVLERKQKAVWGSSGTEAQYVRRLRKSLAKSSVRDRAMILQLARKLAKP